MEKWKSIPFNKRYQISNFGRVKVLPIKSPGTFTSIEHFRKPGKTWNGYCRISLNNAGRRKAFTMHRLIAIAFIPNPENKKCINHKNGKRDDNRIENLEWCTHSENSKHGFSSNGRKSAVAKKVFYEKENKTFDSITSAGVYFNVHLESIRNWIKWGWHGLSYKE